MNCYKTLLNANIKNLRKQNNLTQDKFAELCGISQDSVGNLENNKYAPSPDTIDKICDAFNITPFDLLLPKVGQAETDKMDLIIKKLKLCNESQLDFIGSMIDLVRSKLS